MPDARPKLRGRIDEASQTRCDYDERSTFGNVRGRSPKVSEDSKPAFSRGRSVAPVWAQDRFSNLTTAVAFCFTPL